MSRSSRNTNTVYDLFDSSSPDVSGRYPTRTNTTKVYYRLLTYSAPYNSFYPICVDDTSLSFLHTHRIPFPGLSKDYLAYICSREGIHPSRAKLYVSSVSKASATRSNQTTSFTFVGENEKINLVIGGCGFSKNNPLIIFLDIDPRIDRTLASLPPSALERGGKKVAKTIRRGCGVVQSCLTTFFGTLQRVPKGME